MQIALISDIHGNEVALRKVLDHLAHHSIDQLICLGDVATLGPHPRAVMQILQDLQCSCVLGNHDHFLLDPGLIRSYTEAPVIAAAVDWARSQLDSSSIDFLRTFQPDLHLALDTETTLRLFHGSPRSHMENILATTAAADLDRMLAGFEATIMASGHTHIQMLRQHRGILLVNPGSVGLPFKEVTTGQPPTVLPHAEYAILEALDGIITVHLHRIPLSKESLRTAVEASDTPLREFLLQQYSQDHHLP